MTMPNHPRCGRRDCQECLITRLSTAAQSQTSRDDDPCELCGITLDELEGEVQQLGNQLAQKADTGQFPSWPFATGQDSGNLPIRELSDPRLSPEIGGYVLRELLREDELGVDYRATHMRLKKDVSVKLLAEDWTRDPCIEFQLDHEIRVLGKLEHPYLATLLDAGKSERVRYFVTEMVDGVDLRSTVDLTGRLSISNACEIVRQASVGMRCAHEQNLIHCGLGPKQLVLNLESESSAIVKVIHLGFERIFREVFRGQSSSIQSGSIQSGSIQSIGPWTGLSSPEVVRGEEEIDAQADIFSLGAILCVLLTGRSGVDSRQVMVDEELLIPEDLKSFVRAMVASSPDDRPTSMGEVTDVMARFSVDQDLCSLVSRAQEAGHRLLDSSHTNPVLIHRIAESRSSIPDEPKTQRSEKESDSVSSNQPKVSASGSVRILLGLAVLSLAGILAGAFYLWSVSNGGYMTIRADSSIEVELELMRDGKTFDTISLSPKTTPVPKWYPSGSYQVKLPDQKTTELRVEGEEFRLRRNDNHVIIIHRIVD